MLQAAARHWALGLVGKDLHLPQGQDEPDATYAQRCAEALAPYRLLPLDDEPLAERFGHGPVVFLLPSLEPVVRVFLALSTQWRFASHAAQAGLRVREGLVYASIPVVCAAHGIAFNAELLDDLRLMEAVAIEESHLSAEADRERQAREREAAAQA